MSVIASWWGAVGSKTAVLLAPPSPSPRPDRPSAISPTPSPAGPVSPLANLDSTMFLFLVLLVVAGGYLMSLRLHPNTKCPRCDGKGFHRGTIFSYATRACSGCGGRGIKPRIGRRVFGPKG